MRLRKLILPLMAALLMFGFAVDSRADISSAAVLYLRIAPGARAAGMGEAFVAIADDATATHWNPAGLGAYPLASSWVEAKVPARLRPITAMAALKRGGASDYMAYEIWAITPLGLARWDNKDWHVEEAFITKTDQTVMKIVESYFGVDDKEKLAGIVEKVADANNRRSYAFLEDLQRRVMDVIPEDYRERESLAMMFDSLLAAYLQCRVNWNKVIQIEEHLREGYRDSVLTDVEIDRLGIAVEKARTRFVPEELVIPYSANLAGEPTSLASTGKRLFVGTDRGLVTYNGRRWHTHTVEDGLPSDTILCLFSDEEQVFIGTSRGPARYHGHRLAAISGLEQLPEGPVTAIGARGLNNMWIVLNDDLYHYDGHNWANYMDYKVVLDDTPESIAEKFAVYGTATETERYLEKFMEVNRKPALPEEAPSVDSVQSSASDEIPEDLMAMVFEGKAAVAPDTTADTALIEEAETVDDTTLADTAAVEDLDLIDDTTAVVPDDFAPGVPEDAAFDGDLKPGTTIRAPFLSSIKGKATSIYVGRDYNVWIGTDYGLLYYDGEQWNMPGYRSYRLKEGDTFEALVVAKRHADSAAAATYAAQLRDINDLDEDSMEVGQRVRIYRNPAAARINRIYRGGEKLYFATAAGLVEFDGLYWGRTTVRGLGHANAVDVRSIEDEVWLASDEKIVMKANAHTQITLMHCDWLPELDPNHDIYYEFFGFVSGSEGWGTFGGNITFITYGTFDRTSEFSPDPIGSFESFDVALTGSYGAPLTSKLKVGLSAKLLYSKLADQGVGLEQGKGTSTGFAVDFGMLYQMTRRLNWGMAITNLGPSMAYIDAAQADPLPRYLSLGLAYKLLRSEYYHLLVTAEVNKLMVGLNDGLREELSQVELNGGAEFLYASIFALRAGYRFDEEGDVKTMTLGVGLALLDRYKFDFSYIPSGSSVALKNTLRISISVIP